MAAEAPKPPRVPAHPSSMAALASSPHPIETPLAAAWAAVWNGCGGSLIVGNGGAKTAFWPVDDYRDIEAPYSNWSADERRGALKALRMLLDISGAGTVGAVFGVSQDRAA